MALLGPVIGPPVGGFIVTFWDWPWIFFMNLPIAAVGLLLVLRFVPNVALQDAKRLDWRGMLLTGVGLAFARAAGEYGSVIFIAGNMPLRSEIAPLLIVIKLEQFDYAGAAAVGLAMLVLSFTGLLILNSLQAVLARRGRA